MAEMTPTMQARMFLRSLFLQSCWSFERMQSLGFAFCLEPWLKARLKDPAERRRALARHQEFFNTQPYMASLVIGMVCALEAEAAGLPEAQKEAAAARLSRLKTAAAGALAGVGDALFWGALKPFSAALGLVAGLAGSRWGGWKSGSVLMAAFFLASYNIPALILRAGGLRWGYDWGDQIAVKLQGFGWQAWIRRVRLAGLVLASAALLLRLGAAPGPLGPGGGAIMVLGCVLAMTLRPAAVTAYRLYAASCLIGILAALSGWMKLG